ncbi:MAG: hypothetical protein ACK58M_20065 [Acidobacteriota bacterium]|jgi:hypothetical protein
MILRLVVPFLVGVGLCFGQEVGLDTYLKALKLAPGLTVDQQVAYLNGIGVRLSAQGMRDLTEASERTQIAPRTTTTSPSPYGRTSPYSYNPTVPLYSPPTYTPPPVTMPSTGVSSRIGGTDYYNFSNGVDGTRQQSGNTDYYNFSNGVSGTAQQVGKTTYQNWSTGVNGTGQRSGNTTYYNWSDGTNATQQRIGNTTYTNFNNGKTCTTQKIGAQSYTNCF